MADQDLITVATEFIDAFNTGDWQRFRGMLANDVVYQETGTQRRIQGADAYVQLCQGWKQAFPDVIGTIQNACTGGSIVAQEITWEGTHTGPLEGPGGTIPATGTRVTVPASFWVIFDGNVVKEAHHYLDVLSLMQQLGVMFAPGQQ
jgi:steroid delta-isomerase-like uncharacterized protein